MKQKTWDILSKSCRQWSIVLWAENLLDCIFTYIGLNYAEGKELNPIMDYLIQHSWSTFFLVKMGIISALTSLLYYLRAEKTLKVLSCFYGILVLYYLVMFIRIFAL